MTLTPELLGADAVRAARAAAVAGVPPLRREIDYPVRVRRLEVLRTELLTPRLLRLVLGGAGIEGFESHLADEHVKFLFPDPGTGELRIPTADGEELDWPSPFPTSREYSVRHLDRVAGEVWFDLVLHRGGLASDWAENARPGDELHVAGPPGGEFVPDTYDRYLLASDESGLPPLARILEQLPATARGWAFVEVDGAGDELDLVRPAGVELHWLSRNGIPAGRSDVLARTVPRHVPAAPEESTYVWFSAEAGSLKPLRRWVRGDLGVPREHTSITGYWKVGAADTHEHFDE